MFFIFNTIDDWKREELSLVWYSECLFYGFFRAFICEIGNENAFRILLKIWRQWRFHCEQFLPICESSCLKRRIWNMLTASLEYVCQHKKDLQWDKCLRQVVLKQCLQSCSKFNNDMKYMNIMALFGGVGR